ncbi:3'-5' exonuclease [Oceanithermus desulfurans]
MVPVEYRMAARVARALREAGEPRPARELAYRALAMPSVAPTQLERVIEPVLDGRFFREEGALGLWEWRYPFPQEGEALVVLDLETTGLSPSENEIIEIALMRVETGRVERFVRLVNPGSPIPPFITRLTGISSADVADAPDVYTALEEALPYLEGAVLVIQNAPFDLGFLRPRARRLGVKIHNEVIDTVQWARRALPRMRRRGLDHLIRAFEVSIETGARHRALGDVEATWTVAREMYYILTAGEPRRVLEV